jgi:hypothetical protein
MNKMLRYKKCNARAMGRAPFGTEIGNSMETYLRVADEGVVAAQFLVGLAHLEGYCVEKNDCSAYYWLRLAEENSGTIRHRSRALIEKLRSTVKPDAIEGAEHMVAMRVQENKLLRSKRPAEFIKPGTESASLRLSQVLTRSRPKVAS